MRSSEHLEGFKGAKVEEGKKCHDEGIAILPSEDEFPKENENENSKEPKSPSPKPCMPPFPFPQRFAQAKLDSQFAKFFYVLKNLHVNISFIDALSQMSMYAKYLKEILSKKRKIDEHETFPLGEECSIVVLNILSTKLKDPDSFPNPCLIDNVSIDRVLCDLGSNVRLMAYLIFKRFNLGELRPTNISLQLANHSINYPFGVLQDAPFKVCDFYVPIDFVILDMDEDACTQIILGRPFLATTGCKIDVKEYRLTFDVGEHHAEFVLFKDFELSPSSLSCMRVM